MPASASNRRSRRRWGLLAVLTMVAAVAAFGFLHWHQPGPPLWSASASQPLVDEWASYTEAGDSGTQVTPTSQPTRISQVMLDGRPALRITVRASDRDRYTRDAQRTELGQGNPTRTFSDGTGQRKMRAGQNRWVAEQILIPRSVRTGHPGADGFFVLNQFKMDGPGGPAVSLAFQDNRLLVRRARQQTLHSAGGRDLGSSGIVARGKWLKVVWHLRWSTGSDGRIIVYADVRDGRGLRRIAAYRGWTLKRAPDGRTPLVHSRIGIYRRAIPHSTTVYFSGYAVATSRDAAQAAAGF